MIIITKINTVIIINSIFIRKEVQDSAIFSLVKVFSWMLLCAILTLPPSTPTIHRPSHHPLFFLYLKKKNSLSCYLFYCLESDNEILKKKKRVGEKSLVGLNDDMTLGEI